MTFNAATYVPRHTPLHAADPRVKIVLLFAYSITLFCVTTWAGLALCAFAFAVCAGLSRLPFGASLRQLVPLWVILAVTLLVNSFSANVQAAGVPTGLGGVSPGLFGEMDPVVLVGTFGFVPAGFGRGCYYIARLALLALASVVLTSTTSPTELSRSLEQFLRPLETLRVPVHDVATIVSIALRFIPVTFDEFQVVRAAQASRGAGFSSGGLASRLRAWQTVLIPLFVGLFRRADVLALAMDARCYGAGKPTHLSDRPFTVAAGAALVAGLAACAAVSVML